MPGGPERKNSVAHTVRALPTLALRAYASVGLRDGFANPVPPAQAGSLAGFTMERLAGFTRALTIGGFPVYAEGGQDGQQCEVVE